MNTSCDVLLEITGFVLNFKEPPSLLETWHTHFASTGAGFKQHTGKPVLNAM